MAQASEAACRHCLLSLPTVAIAAPQHVSSLPCTTATSTFLASNAHQTHAGDPGYLLCSDESSTCLTAIACSICQSSTSASYRLADALCNMKTQASHACMTHAILPLPVVLHQGLHHIVESSRSALWPEPRSCLHPMTA